MENKLKLCPFCGSEAVICEDGELSFSYKVFCLNPDCDGQYGWCVSKEQAVNGWYRRAGENNDD